MGSLHQHSSLNSGPPGKHPPCFDIWIIQESILVRNSQMVPPSMAYLVFSQIEYVAAAVIANIGEHLVTLMSNQVPIRHAEELVTGSEQRLVVGVVCNISHSVGHDNRGKLQKLLKKNSKQPQSFNQTKQDPYWTSRPSSHHSITAPPISNPLDSDQTRSCFNSFYSCVLFSIVTTHFISTFFITHLLLTGSQRIQ